jgi:Uncharacterized protein conserved in bacteria
MSLKNKIINYTYTLPHSKLDTPFKKHPEYLVFRHTHTNKWYGMLMHVPYATLGFEREGSVDILNVKLSPEWVALLRNKPGYAPAYHMNKEHWLTILLDDSCEKEQLFSLLEDSYYLTN